MLDLPESLRVILTMVHEFSEDEKLDCDALNMEYSSLLYFAGQRGFLEDYSKFREELSIVASHELEVMNE